MSGFSGIPGLQAVTTVGNSTTNSISFNGAIDINGNATVNSYVDFKSDSGFRTNNSLFFGDSLETRIIFDGNNLCLDPVGAGAGALVFIGDGYNGGEIKAQTFSTVDGVCAIAFNTSTNELEFTVGGLKVLGASSTLLTAYVATSGFGGGGSANSVTATVNFGASFTDKAQIVVTGQSWVTATTEIITQIKTPSGVDPDEMYLLDPEIAISNIIAGTGFTITVYSNAEARGTYEIMCVGV